MCYFYSVSCSTRYLVIYSHVEDFKTQLKRGVLEMLILELLSKRDMYGWELIEEMGKLDIDITEGTIYPLLARLKSNKNIGSYLIESNKGAPRKYYTITKVGIEY